ncbi:MAG: PqqD family protein [Caldilineales bacterium]|nr:PqqD family protein [Caldilineales bacterium]
MPIETSFRINSPHVIAEVIEDEAIIVNLDSGAYYSLRDAGALIWRLIEQGAAFPQLVGELAQRYEGTEAGIAAGARNLIAELQGEGLILAGQAAAPGAFSLPAHNGRPPFQPPALEKYTDMADLLLLDPIHEVDEGQGWPAPRR